jgi:hypothetical protein
MKIRSLFRAYVIMVIMLYWGAAGVSAEDIECEWMNETAWAEGDRYVQKGNWATFTPYEAGKTVILYAGQDLEAGKVDFSAPVEGYEGFEVTITITLNDGWKFEEEEENAKIQDYEFSPLEGNPSPGRFAHKGSASTTESSFSIIVPANNFYGIHVDVQRLYCPEPEPETDPDSELQS